MFATSPPKRFDEIARWLPGQLMERVRRGKTPLFQLTGDFILYWMHSTLRLQDNPALDLACFLEGHLDKPVVLLSSIATDMPGANERSLLFLRQAALDIETEAEALHLPCTVLAGNTAEIESLLIKLCRKAVAVITDDTPIKWLGKISNKIEQTTHAPLFYVDSDSLIPHPHTENLSFADFRDYCDKTELLHKEYSGFIPPFAPPPKVSRKRPATFPSVAPLDAETDWLAQLGVDHERGPVWHRPGGAPHAQRLWQDIRPTAIRTGDSSRFAELVPYLRFGMIAPQKIVFDALLESTPAALRFLEETLLLRHYASLFCARQPLHHSIHCLPQWARQSIQQIPQTLSQPGDSLVNLAQATAGDSVWNQWQDILRHDGSLPAAAFDFWCKRLLVALPAAARDIEDILRFYGKFSLTCDDPWVVFQVLRACGLEQTSATRTSPVYGLLTPPELPPPARAAETFSGRPESRRQNPVAIAVIGAGISGLACAQQLTRDGYEVRIFEQDGAPGGRATTRRIRDLAFDTGAPLLTTKHPDFRFVAESWEQMGVVDVWNSKIYLRDKDAGLALSKDPFVPVPGMDAIARHLAQGLDVACGTRIDRVQRVSGGWRLTDATGEDQGFYDIVIFATPPTAAKVIEGMPDIGEDLIKHIKFFPLWVGSFAFPTPLAIPYDAIAVAREVVQYAFRDSAKPKRRGREQWVLHSSPEWAMANTGLRGPVAAQKLLRAFFGLFHLDIEALKPDFAAAILWPRAMVVQPLGRSHVWHPSRLVFCGDWCLGRRIEDAYQSGVAAAARVRTECR